MKKPNDNESRFHTKYVINETTNCWEWKASLNNIGYPFFRYINKDINKMMNASRVSYELHYGPIPNKHFVIHTCNNKKCVNPAHLTIGTYQEMRDLKRSQNIRLFREKGFKTPLKTCEHCNKECPINVFPRYHGDNCKYKT